MPDKREKILLAIAWFIMVGIMFTVALWDR